MGTTKAKTIQEYIDLIPGDHRIVAANLTRIINTSLPEAESKIWHGGPVWFINGNPVVGFSLQKGGVGLMFWSGADFAEPLLVPGSGKFKDASIFYNDPAEIEEEMIVRWLKKAKAIQWDYKNIVKRKGRLVRLTPQ